MSMEFDMQITVLSGQKGTMTEQTDRKTGEVTKMKEPLKWASFQALGEAEMEDFRFGYKPLKLPCTHEVFDQIRSLWTDKKKDFKVKCEMRSLSDRNGAQKMTPFAIAVIG